MTGFLIAGLGIIPATLVENHQASVWLTCFALFGLELTVGVSWAIPLDIGGDYAGSVAAIMNTCGNISGTIAPAVAAYLVRSYGWETPFFVAAVLCVVAAGLYLKIDPGKRIFTPENTAVPQPGSIAARQLPRFSLSPCAQSRLGRDA